MKIAYVEAMFPELKGKYIYHTGRGEGGSPKVAINAAMRDCLKSIKGKRFSTLKCTITVVNAANEVRITEAPDATE